MKRQRAIHIFPNKGIDILNDLLDDKWLVCSTTPYRPSVSTAIHDDIDRGTILVILEKGE